jgi:hypothetical protein
MRITLTVASAATALALSVVPDVTDLAGSDDAHAVIHPRKGCRRDCRSIRHIGHGPPPGAKTILEVLGASDERIPLVPLPREATIPSFDRR